MRIYTKTGDDGSTGLFGGSRVSKADPRVAAYGDVDELNALIGLTRTMFAGVEIDAALADIQRDLFALGAILADPAHKIADRVTKATIGPAEIARLEGMIDEGEATLPPLKRFILAGGSHAGAFLHLARTVCRRAERSVVALGADAVPSDVVVYLNRLSDLLFVLARLANQKAGLPETEW